MLFGFLPFVSLLLTLLVPLVSLMLSCNSLGNHPENTVTQARQQADEGLVVLFLGFIIILVLLAFIFG